MSQTGMMAAVAAAAGLGDEPVNVTAALITSAFPDVAAELMRAGASAERDRLAQMDAQALPGHERLVAQHKADASKTPGDLAMAIVAAEKEQRKAHLAALDTDEQAVKGLKSVPANATAEAPDPLAGKTGEERWKAEYEASDALREEFPTFETYAGWKKLEAEGRVRTTAKSK